MEKLGEFNHIKHQLEEQGSQVSNLVHKLLGKLPLPFESFTDNIYLGVPFSSYDEAVGLLLDKLLSREANKPSNKSTNSAFMGNASSTSKGQIDDIFCAHSCKMPASTFAIPCLYLSAFRQKQD